MTRVSHSALYSPRSSRDVVACPCGVMFERWVTPEDAELDLRHAARLN